VINPANEITREDAFWGVFCGSDFYFGEVFKGFIREWSNNTRWRDFMGCSTDGGVTLAHSLPNSRQVQWIKKFELCGTSNQSKLIFVALNW
jgi:hypothetical protein